MPHNSLSRRRVHNWPITSGEAGPSRLTNDNSIDVLIDSQVALAQMVDAVSHATSAVYLTQSEFHPNFVAVYDAAPALVLETPRPEGVLTDVICRTAQKNAVRVFILLNQNLVLPDSLGAIQKVFEGTSVCVRGFPTSGPHVMHAKVLIIDEEEAFIIGSPFRQDYWDGSDHLIYDRRRGSGDVQPKHDVSLHLRGSAVTHVAECFAQLWNYVSHTQFEGRGEIALPLSRSPPAGSQSLQIVRSVTPMTLTRKGETGILEAYRRAISNARDFIYLENQYFTSRAIVSALRSALKNSSDLQIILLINENPDMPSYRLRQHDALKRLGLDVKRSPLGHPRIGVFTLWSRGFEAGRLTLRRCYVHSKVAIVDDVWATIGSANLDGPSLDRAEEFKPFANPRKHRSMELNAILCNLGNPKDASVARLRRSLWREHLEAEEALASRPSGGWLALWKRIATDNVASLNSQRPKMDGRILPYSTEANSKKELTALGVSTDKINVIEDPFLGPLTQRA